MDLEKKGIMMNCKKIRRLMNKYEIKTHIRKKNPYKDIMKKTQEHATCTNILNRQCIFHSRNLFMMKME